jgi:hypothetical protein
LAKIFLISSKKRSKYFFLTLPNNIFYFSLTKNLKIYSFLYHINQFILIFSSRNFLPNKPNTSSFLAECWHHKNLGSVCQLPGLGKVSIFIYVWQPATAGCRCVFFSKVLFHRLKNEEALTQSFTLHVSSSKVLFYPAMCLLSAVAGCQAQIKMPTFLGRVIGKWSPIVLYLFN